MTSTPATANDTTARAPVMLDGFEVLDACHRETVLRLGELAQLVASLDGGTPGPAAREAAAAIVAFFSTTAREHHLDEEQHVFPALLAGGNDEIVQAVQRLRQDHGWLEADWNEIEPQLDALASGQAWVDLDVLREGTEIFVALSRDHVALEESFIYPQARATIGGRERSAMGREMAARRRARRGAPPSR